MSGGGACASYWCALQVATSGKAAPLRAAWTRWSTPRSGDLDKEERQRRARLEEAMSVHAEDDLHDMCDMRAELEDERARMRAQMEDAEVAALHALQERRLLNGSCAGCAISR